LLKSIRWGGGHEFDPDTDTDPDTDGNLFLKIPSPIEGEGIKEFSFRHYL